QPASGFAFDFVDETTPLASVKRISPAYDNDVDIGTSAKRFKNIEAVSINGTPAPSGDGFLPRDGSLAMTGNLDLDGKEAKGVSALRMPNVVVGNSASVGGGASVAVGNLANGSGLGAIAIGNASTNTANNSLAVGLSSNNSGVGGIALGRVAVNSGTNATSIGTSC